MVSVNLVANTDLQTAAEFEQLGGQENGSGGVVRLGEIATSCSAPRPTTRRCASTASATFMGIWSRPRPTRST